MVVTAVAGGTGGVGRTVLDAIAESGEHRAIVLSRTVSLPRNITAFDQNIKFLLFRPQQTIPDISSSIMTKSSRLRMFSKRTMSKS
jgi:shikimate 5-dehydrogenase